MVEFGPSQQGKFNEFKYQDTAIYDIIHYDDAFAHHVETNDRVLALIDKSDKYAPAEVLEGFEKRHSHLDEHKSNLNSSTCMLKV
jgi:hypothetical protein